MTEKNNLDKYTGILFELLVRQITADVLNGDESSSANKLLKKHFSEHTCLGKEQRLYQLLIEESTADVSKAESLLQVVRENHKKLGNKEAIGKCSCQISHPNTYRKCIWWIFSIIFTNTECIKNICIRY